MAGGLRIELRVTPRASRDGLDGITIRDDGQAVLAMRVRAVPSDGEANDAVLALVAKGLDLPRRAVVLEAGATARRKTLLVQGAPDELTARLRGWLAACGHPFAQDGRTDGHTLR